MADITVPIKLKKSSTVGAVPTSGQLQEAELALNVVDQKLYSKRGSSTVFQVAPSYSEFTGRVPWITPEQFGAVGNGVADDTAAVQNAFNALSGRDQYMLLRGRYRLTGAVTVANKGAFVLGSNVSLTARLTGFTMVGEGQLIFDSCLGMTFQNVAFTALSNDTTKNPDLDLVYCYKSTVFTFDNCLFEGFGVAGVKLLRAHDGNYKVVSGVPTTEIENACGTFRFDGIRAVNASGEYGMYFGLGCQVIEMNNVSFGGRGPTTTPTPTTKLLLFNGGNSVKITNFAFNFGKYGVYMQNSGFVYMAAGGFENGVGTPLYIGQADNVKVIGCYFSSDSSGDADADGIYIGQNCRDINILGSVIRANGGHGIYVAGTDVVINGNNIVRNSTSTFETKDGVYVASTAKKVAITGNKIGNQYTYNSGTNSYTTDNALQKHGINLNCPQTEVMITGNNLLQNRKASIGGSTTPTGDGIGLNRTDLGSNP